jgi:hypothetical protein
MHGIYAEKSSKQKSKKSENLYHHEQLITFSPKKSTEQEVAEALLTFANQSDRRSPRRHRTSSQPSVRRSPRTVSKK